MATQYTIYYAGALFDHKHLGGNALLAARIEELSEGRYRCVLPQDLEQTGARAVDIRNQDLRMVMECDLGLYNFDGADLDPGQIVEYVYAKMLDIPCVILRSDFRHGGDQEKGGDPWNLMASFFPRTRILHLNGMQWYQEAHAQGGGADEVTARFHRRIASAVIELLDAAREDAPILEGAASADVLRLYRWALRFPGGGLAEALPGGASPADYAQRLVADKVGKRLLP